MRQVEFGSFSPSFVGVELKFATLRNFNEFAQLWLNPGTPGRLENASKVSRFTKLSAGTSFEHEVRHFHDFLWSCNSINIFWFRIQALMNSIGIIKHIGDAKDFDILPVPIPRWLSTDSNGRAGFIAQLQLWPGLERARVWDPIYTDPKDHVVGKGTRRADEGIEGRDNLYRILSAQYAKIKEMRDGYHPRVDGAMRFTPRFAYELSALIAQFGAVYITYGEDECVEFLNGLDNQMNPVMRTFVSVLDVLSTRTGGRRRGEKFKSVSDVDWRAVQAVSFWALAGNYHLDGQMGCPAVRLSMLMEAIYHQRHKMLPMRASRTELLSLWSNIFGVSGVADAIRTSRKMLEVNSGRVRDKLQSLETDSPFIETAFSVVDGVLLANKDMIDGFEDDLEGFLECGRYNTYLQKWPGGLTMIDISETGYEFDPDSEKMDVRLPQEKGSPNDRMFLPSFSGNKTYFDVEKCLELRQAFVAMDVLFDHHQVTPADEQAAIVVLKKDFGKEVVFVD